MELGQTSFNNASILTTSTRIRFETMGIQNHGQCN